MATRRSAKGSGTIRLRSDGRWEARYTVGRDPGTGKQIQKSVFGHTQKEVRQKLTQATRAVDSGTYRDPCKMTLGQWADIWTAEYLGSVKPRTQDLYKDHVRLYIKPALGAVRLEEINPHTVQRFYNGLSRPQGERKPLAPKTVKNVHGILHKCLQQAVNVGYLAVNPADRVTLPRREKPEIRPLSDQETAAFLARVQGDALEILFTVAVFTGLREGELLGLCWDCVDFTSGTIVVKRQLSRRDNGRRYELASPKNGKPRTITPAASIMALLKRQHRRQMEDRLKAGELWEDSGLVFTTALGGHLSPRTVYDTFKRHAVQIGRPDARFHDLRHTYAVAAIRAGDDIKTVQGNLGHATAAFTLDVYGHVTDQMKADSAARMELHIQALLG